MMPIVLLGSPGSGKGTQGARIARHFAIPHISTGEMLRDHVRRNTIIGHCVKETLDNGLLVPDGLVTDLIAWRLREADCDNGYLFDGFPRTLDQAQWFYAHYEQPVVVLLDVPKDEVIRRIANRREGRPDDAEAEVVLGRLREYDQFTAPLIGYYEREGALNRVDGTLGIEGTFDCIRKLLEAKEVIAYG